MTKSEYLETLEKLQKALTSFDMSFGVSNKMFRLSLVSEILDTTCLFEQLYESWCEHLPFGEGPDSDVNFSYWKELSNWEPLLSSAIQNACIDDYPFDMGNGMTSDMISGNRRKNYLKSVASIFRRSGYSGSEVASCFIKEVNGEPKNSMTFGNMVHDAISPLLLTLEKIDHHLTNPDKALFVDYFERQEYRCCNNCEDCRKQILEILNEDLPTRRKCNKLNALRDELWQNLYKSKFLDALKDGINTYDINDFHTDHPDIEKTEEEIRELLAFEELVDNMVPNKERTGQYIFKHRKSLSFEDISSFYVYLYATPIINNEIENLGDPHLSVEVLKEQIMSDIIGLVDYVKDEYKDTYPNMWNQIFEDKDVIQQMKEISPTTFKGGYNQKLVCNIVGMMCDKGIFTKTKNKIDTVIYTDKTIYKYLTELAVEANNTSCAMTDKVKKSIVTILDTPS